MKEKTTEFKKVSKTEPYGFRLAGYSITFRLEIDSNEWILFNYLLSKHPRMKNRITYVIDSIFRYAMKDFSSEGSKLTENMKINLWSSLKSKFGSNQKAVEELFRRAVDGWTDLYHKGQAPQIFPRVKYVPLEEKPETTVMMETGKVITEREVVTEKIERKIERTKMTVGIERIKTLFPENYRETLNFDEDRDGWIVRLPYYDREKWVEMLNIVKDKNGRFVSQRREGYFKIPKK